MKILAFTCSGTMIGGANRSFYSVIEGLSKIDGNTIKVVLPQEGELSRKLDLISVEWLQQKGYPIGDRKIDSPINFLKMIKHTLFSLIDWSLAYKISRQIEPDKYDVIYINDNATYVGAMVAYILKKPYVWHFRTDIDEKANFVPFAKELFNSCGCIIAISHEMKAQYLKNPTFSNAKIQVLHNGIPIDVSSRASLSRKMGFHILHCGRIITDKCQIDSIKAVQILIRKYKDIYLHIVGLPDGSKSNYYKFLRDYVRSNKLEEHVIFEGQINTMAEFRRNINCELMCSKREPFGRTTVEGMRSGLVVIGADSGATPEIISDGETGLLYRQGDFKELASQIEKVYLDEKLAKRLADNAYEFSNHNFLMGDNVLGVDRILREYSGN